MRSPHRAALGWLFVLLAIAAALRVPRLSAGGYGLDEFWTAEVATGRGSPHLDLPHGVVLDPPDFYSLATAPPWYAVWTHMQVTHPPLYFQSLRLWMDAFGQGDTTERGFSVLLSLVALAFFFDAVRLLNGQSVAVWAGLLMAVAPPMIDHARMTRNYAMELATALAAVDAVVRIEKLGVNRWRVAGLAISGLCTLLTHYFAIGLLGALAFYGLIRLRGRTRLLMIGAFAVAGIAFVICWGPFMWKQRVLFSTHDPMTLFLLENEPGHLARSLHRVLLVPVYMLVNSPGRFTGLASLGGVVYVLPFLLFRRKPGLLLWGLLLPGTVVLLLAMDAMRHTRHLALIRYSILAGPPVYALIPALASCVSWRWARTLIPAGASLLVVGRLTLGPTVQVADAHEIVRDIGQHMGSDPLFVFIGTSDHEWSAGANYLMLSRYLDPFPGRIALLNGPATDATLARLAAAPRVVVVAHDEDPAELLPSHRAVWSRQYLERCRVFQMARVDNFAAPANAEP